MPYRRKTKKPRSKRPYRRRRIYRRRRVSRHIFAGKHLKVMRFVNSPAFTQSTGVTSFGASQTLANSGNFYTVTTGATQGIYYFSVGLSFCLDDLEAADKASLVAQWETWSINAIMVSLTPIVNVTAAQLPGNAESALSGWIHSCVDLQDNNAFGASSAGVNLMRQFPTYKTTRFTRGFSRMFRPRIQQPVFGGVTPGYTQSRSRQLNTTYTDVNHYGFKFIIELIDPSSTLTNTNFKLEAALGLTMGQPK